jgi:hypothetical protein
VRTKTFLSAVYRRIESASNETIPIYFHILEMLLRFSSDSTACGILASI